MIFHGKETAYFVMIKLHEQLITATQVADRDRAHSSSNG